MRYVVGVDGGATKTHALVVDETGNALGFGQGGPSNYHLTGLPVAVGEIGRAIMSALAMAQIGPRAVEVGCYCLAGADLPEDFDLLGRTLSELEWSRRVIVKNDTMAALRAGLTRPWGIVLICGTGFNAAGRAPDGRELGFPGLGPISGDWGGGGTLSEEIIRAVMRAWDGRGQPTALTPRVLAALGNESEQELMVKLHHEEIPRDRLLSLVPLLFEAALAGDEVAIGLVIQAGTELGISANALIRRLGLEATDVEIVLGGSVFKGEGPLLVDTVTQVVHQQAPRARIKRLAYEPVVGAALLALESLGVTVTEQVCDRLSGAIPHLADSQPQDIAVQGPQG